MHISGADWVQLAFALLQVFAGFFHGKQAQKNNDSKL